MMCASMCPSFTVGSASGNLMTHPLTMIFAQMVISLVVRSCKSGQVLARNCANHSRVNFTCKFRSLPRQRVSGTHVAALLPCSSLCKQLSSMGATVYELSRHEPNPQLPLRSWLNRWLCTIRTSVPRHSDHTNTKRKPSNAGIITPKTCTRFTPALPSTPNTPGKILRRRVTSHAEEVQYTNHQAQKCHRVPSP